MFAYVYYLQKEWTKEGLDRVELAEYDFYLSWPNASTPNYIRLLNENGKIVLLYNPIFLHKMY